MALPRLPLPAPPSLLTSNFKSPVNRPHTSLPSVPPCFICKSKYRNPSVRTSEGLEGRKLRNLELSGIPALYVQVHFVTLGLNTQPRAPVSYSSPCFPHNWGPRGLSLCPAGLESRALHHLPG